MSANTTRVKIFAAASAEELETMVNEWLQKNTYAVEVVDITTSTSDSRLSTQILYRDRPREPLIVGGFVAN
jgi:hypothetical protein